MRKLEVGGSRTDDLVPLFRLHELDLQTCKPIRSLISKPCAPPPLNLGNQRLDSIDASADMILLEDLERFACGIDPVEAVLGIMRLKHLGYELD